MMNRFSGVGAACGVAASGYCALQTVLQCVRARELARLNPKLTVTDSGDIEGQRASVVVRLVVSPLLLTIDAAVWTATLGPLRQLITLAGRSGTRAVPVGEHRYGDGDAGRSSVWSDAATAKSGQLISRPGPAVTTLWELCSAAHVAHTPCRSLGTRPLLQIKAGEKGTGPDGKPVPAKDTRVYGETEWLTFGDVKQKVLAFGAALKRLGMKGQPGLGNGSAFDSAQGPHTMLIWEDTCAEWMIAAQGAFSQSIVVATAYATLGVDAVVGAVNEAGVTVLLCNDKNVDVVAAKAAQMPSLKHIIYTSHMLPGMHKKDSGPHKCAVPTHYFYDLLAEKAAPLPPKPDDVAVLMYTSGSTGAPKGVKVSHGNLLATLTAVGERINSVAKPGQEAGIGYLPLAHIFEMAMEFYFFGTGCTIGYADPFSLMTAGSRLNVAPHGAIEEFRPTVLAGVPKIWEGVKLGVSNKVAAGTATGAHLFSVAMRAKLAAIASGSSTPLFDKLVFGKTKAALGGRCKLCISGGGAISPTVQNLIRCILCCNLVQGYGLTETCAGATVQYPADVVSGNTGAPIGCCEILLHSEPEISDADGKPYLSTDTHHLGAPCRGRGEVWIRGPCVTSGYYKKKDLTAEAFWTEGTPAEARFHKTGDIAIFTPNGTLRIVDRKKNLVKLRGGEYIRLEQMNQAFNSSPYVNPDQGTSAYGDGDMDRAIALVQPNVRALEKFADEAGIQYDKADPRASLAANPAVRKEVLASLVRCGQQQELTSLEKIVGVAILTSDWSPANGCLTATLKIVPSGIKRFNKAEIEQLKKETHR